MRENSPLSRRDLLSGRLHADGAPAVEHHVSSLVVHARLERVPDVLAALSLMPEAEVHGEPSAGKIVVTLETGTEHDVVHIMGRIGELPGVLSTALVYDRFEAVSG